MFPACQKHDWMYHKAEIEEDKLIADLVFLLNMILLVIHEDNFLDKNRLYRVMTYFIAVYYYGGGAFSEDEAKKLPVQDIINELEMQYLPS